ncbi:MAG: SirB2 family protein [Burkholderiales bacterium]|nr:SirB2 family protein [Burkholderiales bacterium]
MDYATLKLIHQCAVVLSIGGFAARWLGVLAGADWARGRLARSLPHGVDTVLLTSAVALAWTIGLNPLDVPWLMAKIIALLVYIGLGMLALRPASTRAMCIRSGELALLTVGYIVSVALTKQVVGFFGLA